VVLHILADAAQFVRDRYADLAEMLRVADPRQLQDVRRADGTRRSPLSLFWSPSFDRLDHCVFIDSYIFVHLLVVCGKDFAFFSGQRRWFRKILVG